MFNEVTCKITQTVFTNYFTEDTRVVWLYEYTEKSNKLIQSVKNAMLLANKYILFALYNLKIDSWEDQSKTFLILSDAMNMINVFLRS